MVGGGGRTEKEAPEVDGVVVLRGTEAEAGTLVRATVVAREGYDLIAEVEG